MIQLVIFLISIPHHIVQESLHLFNSPTRPKQLFVFLDILFEFILMWFINNKWLEEIFQKYLSVFQWMIVFAITFIRFIINSNLDGLEKNTIDIGMILRVRLVVFWSTLLYWANHWNLSIHSKISHQTCERSKPVIWLPRLINTDQNTLYTSLRRWNDTSTY